MKKGDSKEREKGVEKRVQIYGKDEGKKRQRQKGKGEKEGGKKEKEWKVGGKGNKERVKIV